MNIGALTATLGVNTVGLYQAELRMKEFERTTISSMMRINAGLKSTGMAFRSFGRAANKYLTLPLAALGGGAFMLFKKYEKELSKITGLVGVSSEQTKKWSTEILKMAPSVAKGPTELGKALYFITSAGIKGNNAMRVLNASAKASAAGLGETRVVADLATSAINAYGQSNLSAARAMDVLVATVREGKAEPAELAASMGMVLPIASAMGVKFNQVGAAMASMTRTGTSASTAAMQLRQMLAAFLKPTEKAEKVLESLGTSYVKVKEGFQQMGTSAKHFRDIIGQKGLLAALMELKKYKDQYGSDVLAKIFPNIRALSGTLDILGSNVEQNIGIFNRMADATGSLEKAFNAAKNTVEFQWQQALVKGKVALITLGKTVSEAFLPVLKKLSDKIVKVTTWFNNLSEHSRKLVVRIGAIMMVVGPLATIFGFLMTNVIPGLVTGIVGLVKVFNILRLAMITNPVMAWVAAGAALVSLLSILTISTNNAAVSQKGYNKELGNTAQLMKNMHLVEYYMGKLKTMNKSQVSELKQRIGQEIRMESDNYAQKMIIANKYLNDYDKKINNYQKRKMIYAAVEVSQEKAKFLKIVEQDKQTHEQQLKQLSEYLTQVNARLKGFKNASVTINGQIFTVDQGKLIADMTSKLGLLKSMNVAYGGTLNLTSQKLAVEKDALQNLIASGLSPTSKYIQSLVADITQLQNKVKESTSPIKTLSDSLAKINALQNELGPSYHGTALKLQLFNQALDYGIKSGGLSIEKYKYLINTIKQLKAELSMQTVGDIFKNVPEQLKKAEQNAKIFGKSFNLINSEINIYRQALQALQGIGGPFTPQQIELITQYGDKLKQLNDIVAQNRAIEKQREGLNELSSAFQQVGQAIGGAAESWLSWAASVLNSLPQIIRMLTVMGVIEKAHTAAINQKTIATNMNTAANVVNASVSAAGAAVDAGASIAGATKAGAGITFPGNLIAITLGVAAVMAALASIPKAKAATHMATGGMVPDGFSNDSFPAMLKSREVVIPLENVPGLLGGSKGGSREIKLRLGIDELHALIKDDETYNDIY